MILSDSLIYLQENGEQWMCWRNQNRCLSGLLLLCYAQSSPALHDPLDCSPPGSSVHGIFQARILERVAISFSKGISQPRDQTHISCVSCIANWTLHHYAGKPSSGLGKAFDGVRHICCCWCLSFHSPLVLFSPVFNCVLSTHISYTSRESSPHSQRWTLPCVHSSAPWTF